MHTDEQAAAASGALAGGGVHAAVEGQPNTFRDRAMEHLRRGTPVFPVTRSKTPFESGGFYTASTYPAQVDRWNQEYPDASVATPTGCATGRVVFDVDPKTGGPDSLSELEERYGKLPDTVRVLTPSGGTHLSFAYPPTSTRCRTPHRRLAEVSTSAEMVATSSRRRRPATNGTSEHIPMIGPSHPFPTGCLP